MYESIGYLNGCSKTTKCQNHQCFFKHRDFYGISPWWTAFAEASEEPTDEQIAMSLKASKHYAEHGDVIFPTLKAHNSTNCITVECKSEK